MKVLGKLTGKNLEDAHRLALSIPLTRAVHSGYAPNRVEAWYEYASNLQSIQSDRAKVWYEKSAPERLAAFGNRHYPGWNSLLICGGQTNISWHRDHGHFEAKAVMLNLGESLYREQPNRGSDKYNEYLLTDGLVVEIDTKLIHSAVQLSDVRVNITYRKIRSQYMPVDYDTEFDAVAELEFAKYGH